MATATKEEALALLEETRAAVLAQARQVARELDAVSSCGVTVEDIEDEIKARGIWPDELDKRWKGAIFPGKNQEFVKTGASKEVRLPGTLHHDGGSWPYWTRRASRVAR